VGNGGVDYDAGTAGARPMAAMSQFGIIVSINRLDMSNVSGLVLYNVTWASVLSTDNPFYHKIHKYHGIIKNK
jgi:hypothetical protein